MTDSGFQFRMCQVEYEVPSPMPISGDCAAHSRHQQIVEVIGIIGTELSVILGEIEAL